MPKYDRELIARMLEDIASFNHMHGYSPMSLNEQARLLREAENLEADAKTVVREVPDGMVLVPREPTSDMLRAAVKSMDAMDYIGEWYWKKGYRAMLSAASGEKGVG